MARRKALTIEQAFARVREHYTVQYYGGPDINVPVMYTVRDEERQAIRTTDQIVQFAETGRDPFNWLPGFAVK